MKAVCLKWSIKTLRVHNANDYEKFFFVKHWRLSCRPSVLMLVIVCTTTFYQMKLCLKNLSCKANHFTGSLFLKKNCISLISSLLLGNCVAGIIKLATNVINLRPSTPDPNTSLMFDFFNAATRDKESQIFFCLCHLCSLPLDRKIEYKHGHGEWSSATLTRRNVRSDGPRYTGPPWWLAADPRDCTHCSLTYLPTRRPRKKLMYTFTDPWRPSHQTPAVCLLY